MKKSKDLTNEEYTTRYLGTTWELKHELRYLIDAYRSEKIDTQTLEKIIKTYADNYKNLLYEPRKPHYFKISIYNYLGQKRLNVLKNIIKVDPDPEKISKQS
jgi:uncharacterized protein (TIGR04540 family)